VEKRHHDNQLDNSAVNALILQQVPRNCKFPPGEIRLPRACPAHVAGYFAGFGSTVVNGLSSAEAGSWQEQGQGKIINGLYPF
jgi:hypothetical protein